MTEYELMSSLGGPSMVGVAWLVYIIFVAIFSFAVVATWDYFKKDKNKK